MQNADLVQGCGCRLNKQPSEHSSPPGCHLHFPSTPTSSMALDWTSSAAIPWERLDSIQQSLLLPMTESRQTYCLRDCWVVCVTVGREQSRRLLQSTNMFKGLTACNASATNAYHGSQPKPRVALESPTWLAIAVLVANDPWTCECSPTVHPPLHKQTRSPGAAYSQPTGLGLRLKSLVF